MTLDEQLRALKEADVQVEVPRHVEARLMEKFDVRGQRRRWRLGQSWPVMAALAAGLIGGATITLVHVGRVPEPPTLTAVPVSESVVLVLEPPGVQETVRVVRIRVARSALEGLGIQTVASQQDSDSVEVDVLVGEDGVARGVRLAM
jgi:hypothetical protein